MEETRKRKRGAEEAGAERSKEKASDCLPISPRGINCNTKISYAKEVSASRSPPSKKSLRARDGIFSASTRLLVS